MKKSLIALSAFALLASCKPSTPSTEDILSVTSPKGTAVFQDNWENIAVNYQCPDWFTDAKFGIFIHWGIYSIFGQGEWYLNYGPNAQEYAKAARGFYPADFDAAEWVDAIKDSGARYITITSRHHDGFSMFHTAQSDYNIVDGTPFRRDILKELADECHKKNLSLHLY